MNVNVLKIPDVKLIEPEVFKDDRGVFLENYNENKFNKALDINIKFIQDNLVISKKNVLRGLHFQSPNSQAKLVSVLNGKILDVVVDMRNNSPTFGQYLQIILSSANMSSLFIPEGFAHGYLVLSDKAIVNYKVNRPWDRGSEKCIIWNDKDLNINWPVKDIILSSKDAKGKSFRSFSLE